MGMRWGKRQIGWKIDMEISVHLPIVSSSMYNRIANFLKLPSVSILLNDAFTARRPVRELFGPNF